MPAVNDDCDDFDGKPPDQVYAYGLTPPLGLKVIVPSFTLHVALVTPAFSLMVDLVFIVTFIGVIQPAESVTWMV